MSYHYDIYHGSTKEKFMEQVADDDTLREMATFADARLREAGDLTLPALRLAFDGRLKLLHKPEDSMVFLEHCFKGERWRCSQESGVHALQRPDAEPLLGLLERDALRVSAMIDDAGGLLSRADALETFPHLDDGSLARLLMTFVPDICEVNVAGIPCWQRVGALHLPDDFPERLTRVIDVLLKLEFKATLANIDFALCMDYGIHFRKEYAQEDDALFRRVVEMNYKGAEKICWKFGSRFVKAKDEDVKKPIPMPIERKSGEIIGLNGKPLRAWKQLITRWKHLCREEIAKMSASGISNAEITKRFGFSKDYARQIVWVHHNMPRILELNGLTEEDLDKPDRSKAARIADDTVDGGTYHNPVATITKKSGETIEVLGMRGNPIRERSWLCCVSLWKKYGYEAISMRNAGMSKPEIARHFGISDSGLKAIFAFPRILELNGLTEEDLDKPDRSKAARIADDTVDGGTYHNPVATITKKSGETIEVLGMRGTPLRAQSWMRNVSIWKKRRREVLDMYSNGISKDEIAKRLGLSNTSILAIFEMPQMLEINGLTEEDLGV